MLLTVPPAALFHGRSSGGEIQWAGSVGPPVWPLLPVAAAVDRTPPDHRAGRAARRSRSALEPFYKDGGAPLATAMLTQRYNAGGKHYWVVVINSFQRLFVPRSFTTFFHRTRFFIETGFPGSAAKVRTQSGNGSLPLRRHLYWRRTSSIEC